MAVFIKELKAENLGPVQKISMIFKKVNVIFGHNEKGKTFLVEFIIKSLFKSASKWSLRNSSAQGKVIVRGITDRDLSFSPNSPEKIEDYLQDSNPGLPPDLSRLLVVKGAELELSDNPKDSDKTIVKKYISQKGVLDTIDERIAPTEKNTTIENGEIIVQRKGRGREAEELKEKYNTITKLLDRVNQNFSAGKIAVLKSEYEELEENILVMENAKKYLAYTLYAKSDEIKRKIAAIDQTLIKNAREQLAVCRSKQSKIAELKEQLKQAEKGAENYRWLSKFREEYDSLSSVVKPDVSKLFLITGITFALSGLITGFVKFVPFYLTAILVSAGITLIVIYSNKLSRSVDSVARRSELKELEEKFTKKFSRDFSKVDMQTLLDLFQKDYETYNVKSRDVPKETEELNRALSELSNMVLSLCGKSGTIENADSLIGSKERELETLNSDLKKIENQIARLNVERDQVIAERQTEDFDQVKYNELKEKLSELERRIKKEEDSLSSLKADISRLTGDGINSAWEVLIDNLRNKKLEVVERLKDVKARLYACNIVFNVIQDFIADEDRKIKERLQSQNLKTVLKTITRRYTDITLAGDSLIVSDGFHDFHLNDLSTGAQEQILLALRVDFSAQIFKENSLFFILDDAFQYSDWKRREKLVDTAFDLAKMGWQIIYFTMDDHIRDLFERKGKLFGDDFILKELGSGRR